MTGRAPLWVGLGLVAAGLVSLVIGAAAGAAGPGRPGDASFFGPGSMMGVGP